MGGIALVIQTVGILIAVFVIFFIIAGIYFLLAKFALKGEGSYSSTLVASGLSAYIGILGVIIVTIVALLMGKYLMDPSAASFMGSDKSTIVGWIYAKLDIFAIWSYIVFAIGLAKMFKSSSTQKYYMLPRKSNTVPEIFRNVIYRRVQKNINVKPVLINLHGFLF